MVTDTADPRVSAPPAVALGEAPGTAAHATRQVVADLPDASDRGNRGDRTARDAGTTGAGAGLPSVGGPDALRVAARLGRTLPVPGGGDTRGLWESLATLAAVDLGLARTVEPHLDALGILAQLADTGADVPTVLAAVGAGPDSTWGVFAAEARGVRLTATPGPAPDDAPATAPTRVLLSGTKPWCSLAGSLTHAIVTAVVDAGRQRGEAGTGTAPVRQAFAVDLRHPGVRVEEPGWTGLGLPSVPSGPVTFDAVPAAPVGGPSWYLDRPGFAWGGIGVAACWYGGAVGVARALWRQAGERELDQIGRMLLGEVDVALTAARTVLAAAAAEVDGRAFGRAEGDADRAAAARLALRTRAVVADAAETVLRAVGHGTGPAPLAFDAAHAQRVADLTLYLRQEHAERDRAALGAALASGPVQDPVDESACPW